MKVLHPSLKKYTQLEVNSSLNSDAVKFLVSHEFGDSGILSTVAEVLEGFVPYDDDFDNGASYSWEKNEVGMEYLGSGCFSSVFKHPYNNGRAIKLFRNYREDSTCYQYLRLCADGTLTYDWCPNVHSLGRIKIMSYNAKAKHWETRDCAYAELDLLPYECHDRDIYMGEWYEQFEDNVRDIYFPFGSIDLKRDNVLGRVNAEGDRQYYITDPIWNHSSQHYVPVPDPIKELYVYPSNSNANFMTNLRENVKHGRVW